MSTMFVYEFWFATVLYFIENADVNYQNPG